MTEFTLWDIVRNLLLAARWTVLLSVIAFIGGGLVAMPITMARISDSKAWRHAARGYIALIQGTPLLVQLFLAFFGLALLGYNVSPLAAAALALTLYTSAFLAEIWRGAVEAVPRGQWEGAKSLALNRLQQMRLIIVPQALRVGIAPTAGFSVQVVKGTALASVIGFVELTKAGTVISNATFDAFRVYGLVALFYFALCYPLSLGAKALERRMGAGQGH
ncbi:MAG: amino acid transporter permease [Hyphomicrobiales bacterium]|nr:amino acid transporter permease [Hyphomicrobiales bacterium]